VRVIALTVGALLLVSTACTSTKTSGTPNATVNGNNAAASSGSCPFSGSTQSQTQAGPGGATTLTKATPSTSGCIDNVQMMFSPTLATSTAAYKTTSSTGAVVLVVQLEQASPGSGVKTGSTTNAHGLNYVKSISIAGASNGITISITLDKQRPFLLNSSLVPPELELAIG
jgi:hypothetical protein